MTVLSNCHVHTDDIGGAIEAGLDAGRPSQIRVTDLREEPGAEHHVLVESPGPPELSVPAPAVAPVTAVVAVATGAGTRRIFASLGVGAVIEGGQAMNPSTAEILDGAEEADLGRDVVILPNNKNIVAVAEQAAQLSTTVRCSSSRPTRASKRRLAALRSPMTLRQSRRRENVRGDAR